MSASREKKKRQDQGPAAETVVETKKGMNKGLKTALGVVVALVLVAVVCFAAFLVNDIYGYISWQNMKIRQNKAR